MTRGSVQGAPASGIADTGTLPARALVIGATVAALLLAGTAALWAHYGTAVFFEMIAAGLAACL
jgi:hypothetical protein